ncbi:hypothetical protein PLESTB_001694500 [Pleodorina starrii]|uniref:Uncharacterized protein n=1 Tax=Pleodorina starrii TaxID=330485 RepID=A0A9W6BZW9_9CHLO|nr:hypothetical protein PLESTB_001694500 [Pleodorina starrii]
MLQQHGRSRPHLLSRRAIPGGSLPRRPTGSSSPADADRYYTFVLGTFKAHRGRLSHLTAHHHRRTYEEWWSELSTTDAGRRYQQCVTAVLDNIEQDHTTRARHTDE